MRIRLRFGGRATPVSLTEAEPNLEQLTALAKDAFSISDCSLSLNGKDILEGDGSTKLDDLGIVSGDLVHVLTDEPVATQNTSEAKTGRQFHNEGNASKILKVDLPTSSGASGSASNTGAAKSTSSAASADEQHILPATTIVFEDAECIRDEHVNRYLHEPTVIQDSTDEAVPQSLEQVFCDNKPCDSQDACVLVLHILMLETGFKAQDPNRTKGSGLLSSCKKPGRYELYYLYTVCTDLVFQLIVVPMGSLLITHGQVQGDALNIQLNVQIKTSMFVKDIHESASQTYQNLPRLARMFKDSLSHPLINKTRTELGLHASNTFIGLMYEIKILILKKLDGKSLCRLSATCSDLQSLCREPQLWRRLYLEEFGRRNNSDLDQDWFQFFKDKYVQREAMRERMRHYTVITPPFMNHPHPPLPFAPIYPPGFVGGDYDRDPPGFPQGFDLTVPFQWNGTVSSNPPHWKTRTNSSCTIKTMTSDEQVTLGGLFGPVPAPLPRPRFDPIGPIPDPLFRPGRGGGIWEGGGNQRRFGRGGGFNFGPPRF